MELNDLCPPGPKKTALQAMLANLGGEEESSPPLSHNAILAHSRGTDIDMPEEGGMCC